MSKLSTKIDFKIDLLSHIQHFMRLQAQTSMKFSMKDVCKYETFILIRLLAHYFADFTAVTKVFALSVSVAKSPESMMS